MTRSSTSRASLALLASASLVVFGTLPAAASDIGAQVGYAKGTDAESGNGLVGAHLELSLAPFLGIQGAVDYRLVESTRIDVGSTNGELNVRSVPVTLTARAYFPGAISPFVAAGAGWYHLVYDYSAELEAIGAKDDNETTFGWHVGAGLRIMVAPRISVYGEGRAVFVDPDRALDDAVFASVKKFDYDSSYFAAGASLHF